MEKITVVVKNPLEKAEIHSVEAKLETFQKIVGGYIEGVCLDEYMSAHNIVTYLNDEGKLVGLKPNLVIFDGQDLLVGSCVFVKGDDEGGDISLKQDEIEYIMQFCKRFAI